ncbi:MAG: outer membrane protein beta-barrel domain [Bacteroidota bacterium]
MIRLFCLYVLLNTSLFAQGTKETSPWTLGVLGSSATTYRFTSADATSAWLKDQLDSTESWTNGYAYGLTADYSFSEKLSIRSGFVFTQTGQALKNLEGYRSFKINYQFIDLPLTFRYAVPTENANLVFGAGPQLTYMVRSRAIYQSIDDIALNKTNINDESLRKLGLAFGAHVSYDRYLGNNSYIEFGLNYRQQVLSIAQGSINRLPFSLGAFLAFRQGF